MGDAIPGLPSAQVLTNTDLLYDIFTFVPLASDNRDSYLAQCPTVSRTFHEPAIRVLWRKLDSLLPLWHLLAPSSTPCPAHYLSNNDDDVLRYLQTVNTAQLCRDPTRWGRFRRHAAHVRQITHRMHPTLAINDENGLLVQSVTMQNGGTTFLPLLRTILWLHPVDHTLLPLFLTSTLRHATFTQFVWPAKTESVLLLRRLRDTSSFLEKIDLDPGVEHDTVLSLIQELACFPRLREVQISRCSGLEPFRVLATKSNLIRLGIGEITGPWAGLGNAISVRGLRHLSVSGDAPDLSCLFGRIRFHALESAKIRLKSPEDTEITAEITSFLALFYNSVSSSALRSFDFTPCPHWFQDSFGDGPALRELIAPILPIRDLRSFTLDAACTLASLDDADIVALATAWPSLEHLSVNNGFTSDSSVSISAIHHLRRHCTRLQELSIPHIRWPTIGVDTIPGPTSLGRSLSHPLRHLSLPNQIVVTADLPLFGPDLSGDGVEAIAKYLFDLFPHLDLGQCRRELDKSSPAHEILPEAVHYDDRWRKVIGHIYSICRARDGL